MLAELIVLGLAIVTALVLFMIFKRLLPLIINSIGALILLWSLNLIGLHVAINLLTVLIVAIGGLIGLVLVVLLQYL